MRHATLWLHLHRRGTLRYGYLLLHLPHCLPGLFLEPGLCLVFSNLALGLLISKAALGDAAFQAMASFAVSKVFASHEGFPTDLATSN